MAHVSAIQLDKSQFVYDHGNLLLALMQKGNPEFVDNATLACKLVYYFIVQRSQIRISRLEKK